MARVIARSTLTEPHATAVTNIPKMTVSKNRISVHTLEVDIRRRMPESQKSYSYVKLLSTCIKGGTYCRSGNFHVVKFTI